MNVNVLSFKMTISMLKMQDIGAIGLMAVVGGCGLIYEYAISHYAGIVLGQVDKAIYLVIGVMLVASGIGAALSGKVFKNPYTGFAYTEILVAISGSVAVLLTAGAYALATVIPAKIASIYGLDPATFAGSTEVIMSSVSALPVIFGFIVGFLIGMEIPLIVRIREDMYGSAIKDNFGTMYGADYAGAGIGAALWVFVMLGMNINDASWMTASVNVFAGMIFVAMFRKRFTKSQFRKIIYLNLLAVLIVSLVASFGKGMHKDFESIMYSSGIEYSFNTKMQHISVSKRKAADGDIYRLYINGKTQFSSDDEGIYHDMLTFPVMEYSKSRENVLIIGGGDGLALRNVLKYNDVKKVTLVDLDKGLIDFFSKEMTGEDGKVMNDYFLKLNERSFSSEKLSLVFGDAFIEIQKMRLKKSRFDVIIVDLPDPSHPNLNKLYSTVFYGVLNELLNEGGGIVVQSTSPYHARKTFVSIMKTFEAVGMNPSQYHHNVPSFSEWGWTMAFKNVPSAKDVISMNPKEFNSSWITHDILKGSFAFGKNFYSDKSKIKANYLSGYTAYNYYQNDWNLDKGVGTFLPH